MRRHRPLPRHWHRRRPPCGVPRSPEPRPPGQTRSARAPAGSPPRRPSDRTGARDGRQRPSRADRGHGRGADVERAVLHVAERGPQTRVPDRPGRCKEVKAGPRPRAGRESCARLPDPRRRDAARGHAAGGATRPCHWRSRHRIGADPGRQGRFQLRDLRPEYNLPDSSTSLSARSRSRAMAR